jgi:RNA polymerase sigma factor (TIGR02999 family)
MAFARASLSKARTARKPGHVLDTFLQLAVHGGPDQSVLVSGSMAPPRAQDITRLLLAWSDGDENALGKLAPLVEAELQRLARHYLRKERPGHTLQPTALVNEAYLRLLDWKKVNWQNRAHFMGMAAKMMRRILVDHARHHRFLKHGGDAVKVSLDAEQLVSSERDPDLIALDEALTRLAEMDPRKSQVVELRFFGGLSVEEAAEVMKISPRTVKREWSLAQAWLHSELTGGLKHDA